MLAPEVAVQVKQALEKEELLRAQYEGIVELIKKYPDEDPEELLEQMSAGTQPLSKEDRPQPAPAIKPTTRRWLPIAAAIILLAGVGTYIAVQSNDHSAKELATAMIKEGNTHPYSGATRGSIAPAGAAIAWKEAFVNNNYDIVVLYLQGNAQRSNEAQFFLALAYLKVTPPQPGKAASLLKELTATNNEYTPDAWLYLGLAQALEDKRQEAIESLSHVEPTAQVKALLDRLRR